LIEELVGLVVVLEAEFLRVEEEWSA